MPIIKFLNLIHLYISQAFLIKSYLINTKSSFSSSSPHLIKVPKLYTTFFQSFYRYVIKSNTTSPLPPIKYPLNILQWPTKNPNSTLIMSRLFLNLLTRPENIGTEVFEKYTKKNGEVANKKYHRGKELGKGGFATCYELTDIEKNKLYAAKIVAKASLTKKRALEKVNLLFEFLCVLMEYDVDSG